MDSAMKRSLVLRKTDCMLFFHQYFIILNVFHSQLSFGNAISGIKLSSTLRSETAPGESPADIRNFDLFKTVNFLKGVKQIELFPALMTSYLHLK